MILILSSVIFLVSLSTCIEDSSQIIKPIVFLDPQHVYPQQVKIILPNKPPFVLDLKKNESARAINDHLPRHLYKDCGAVYHGTVNNDNSNSVFNLCDGLQGIFTYKDIKYSIRRAFPSDNTKISLVNIHTHHILTNKTQENDKNLRHSRYRKDTNAMGSTLKAVKFMELYLVNDKSIYNYFNKDLKYIKERCKRIASILDSKFRHLRIRIILAGVEIWRDKDLIEVSGSSHTTLMRFMNYRRHSINKRVRNDNAQFLTKQSFDGGRTVGKAPIATICSDKYSAGINHDSHTDPIYVANVIAHELGHNLGMHHDDRGECTCLDHPTRKCIMNKHLDGKVKSFSKCSKDYFEKILQEGHGGCLFDFPTDRKKPSICGNGIIEKGEECDCGHSENCAKFGYCCNQITCKLFKNATCAAGECCHQCQYKKSQSICRKARGDCDLPEFCSGNASICPADVHIQDTHSCYSDGIGYCSFGVCKTHTHQCQEIFDKSSMSADGYCYKELNTKGIEAGHCGQEGVGYKACSLHDSYCGKLQCENNSMLTSGSMYNRIRWTNTGTTMNCVSKYNAEKTNHANDGDLALVRDGTRCADDKICLNKKCVAVQQYRQITNITSCPKKCSNHGVCNSNTNCHCDTGWNPPFCNTAGSGGSIDSGPPPSWAYISNSLQIDRRAVIIASIACAIVCSAVLIFAVQLSQKLKLKKNAKEIFELKSLLKDSK